MPHPRPFRRRIAGWPRSFTPALNAGNKDSEERFKEISVAYGLLSDADKRARYDRGEIDAPGTERPRQRFYKDFAAEGAADQPYQTIPVSPISPIAIFCPSCSGAA